MTEDSILQVYDLVNMYKLMPMQRYTTHRQWRPRQGSPRSPSPIGNSPQHWN